MRRNDSPSISSTTTSGGKLIDYTKQGKKLDDDMERGREQDKKAMYTTTTESRRNGRIRDRRSSPFGASSGDLLRETIAILKGSHHEYDGDVVEDKAERNGEDVELVDFFLKIPRPQERRDREKSDLRQRFNESQTGQDKRGGSIIKLILSPPDQKRKPSTRSPPPVVVEF